MSWWQLVSIKDEAIGYVIDERTTPPAACPNDGEPLREGPDGELFCPFDGWRPGGRYVSCW